MTTRQSAGTRSRNAVSSSCRTAVPVGLFGVQTKISLVAVGDGGCHRGQVVAVVHQRHLHRGGVRQVGQVRVGLERPPRVDHLGARLADGLQQLLGDADRAAADRDVLGRHAEPARDRLGQLGCAVVGVPVDVGGRIGEDGRDRRQRLVRRLVGRQLEGPATRRRRRLAWLVAGELVEYLAGTVGTARTPLSS